MPDDDVDDLVYVLHRDGHHSHRHIHGIHGTHHHRHKHEGGESAHQHDAAHTLHADHPTHEHRHHRHPAADPRFELGPKARPWWQFWRR